MNWKKPIRFTVGGEKWEIPLNILILLLVIALFLMLGGAWMGFSFGGGKI